MSVASAAVGPASGCETMGTGLRPGCTQRYSCSFRYFSSSCLFMVSSGLPCFLKLESAIN